MGDNTMNMSEYINISDAEIVRIIENHDGTYSIDAADKNGGYSEEIWDCWNNNPITELETAIAVAPQFAKTYDLNVPIVIH